MAQEMGKWKPHHVPNCEILRETISVSQSPKQKHRSGEKTRSVPSSSNFAKALQELRKKKEVMTLRAREHSLHVQGNDQLPPYQVIFGNKTKLNFRIKHKPVKELKIKSVVHDSKEHHRFFLPFCGNKRFSHSAIPPDPFCAWDSPDDDLDQSYARYDRDKEGKAVRSYI
jgi:hypothetical protein